MRKVHYIRKKEDFIKQMKSRVKETGVVLDIGCGIRPEKYVKPKFHICCEPYREYVDYLLEKRAEDKRLLVLNCDWQKTTEIFPPKSVDSVFLLDVVEHLPKRKGKRLLAKTEKIAREQVLVFTPLGFLKQEHPGGIDAWKMHGGKWQTHHSGWNPKDFSKEWDVYVCKRYHFVDNLSRKFKKPYGAIFAIRNYSLPTKESIRSRIKTKLRSLLAK